MTRRQYAGGAAATTITTPIASSGGGTVAIATSVGWPDGAVGKFHVVIDAGNSSEEKILIDNRSGTTLTFVSGGRGADGTTSTSHAAGATIWLCSTALDFDEANAHINAPTAAHAATAITFASAGNISATNVQAAIAELDSEIDARTDAAESAVAAIVADNWVTQPRLADASVGTAEIIDANVTAAKLAATLPRGHIGYVEGVTTQINITTITDLAGMTLTFTAVANRKYEVLGQIRVTQSTNAAAVTLTLRDSAGTVYQESTEDLAVNGTATLSIHKVFNGTLAAGSVTLKLSLTSTVASVGVAVIGATRPATLGIKDIGGA